MISIEEAWEKVHKTRRRGFHFKEGTLFQVPSRIHRLGVEDDIYWFTIQFQRGQMGWYVLSTRGIPPRACFLNYLEKNGLPKDAQLWEVEDTAKCVGAPTLLSYLIARKWVEAMEYYLVRDVMES